MGLFSGIKNAFSKKDDANDKYKYKTDFSDVPKSRKEVPLAVRPTNVIDAEHRQNIENSLTQLHRDYLSRRVSFDVIMDALEDLRDKMDDDLVLARSKRLPSTLYGIFTSTKDLKIQRAIAEIIHAQAVKGNLDAVRIAKMLNQLANDPITKDLMSRAAKI